MIALARKLLAALAAAAVVLLVVVVLGASANGILLLLNAGIQQAEEGNLPGQLAAEGATIFAAVVWTVLAGVSLYLLHRAFRERRPSRG